MLYRQNKPFPFFMWAHDTMIKGPNNLGRPRTPEDFPHGDPHRFLAPDDPRLQWPKPSGMFYHHTTDAPHEGYKQYTFQTPPPNTSTIPTHESVPSVHDMEYIGSPKNGVTFAINRNDYDTNINDFPQTIAAPGVYEDNNTGRHFIVKTGRNGRGGNAANQTSIPMRAEAVAHKLYGAFATPSNGIDPVDARLHSDDLGGAEIPPGTQLPLHRPVYSVTQLLNGAKTVDDLSFANREQALATAAKGWVVDSLLTANHGDMHGGNLMVNADRTGVHRIDTGGHLGMSAWGNDMGNASKFWDTSGNEEIMPGMSGYAQPHYGPTDYASPNDTLRQMKETIDSWESNQDQIKKAISYHHRPDDLYQALERRIKALRNSYEKFKDNPIQMWAAMHGFSEFSDPSDNDQWDQGYADAPGGQLKEEFAKRRKAAQEAARNAAQNAAPPPSPINVSYRDVPTPRRRGQSALDELEEREAREAEEQRNKEPGKRRQNAFRRRMWELSEQKETGAMKRMGGGKLPPTEDFRTGGRFGPGEGDEFPNWLYRGNTDELDAAMMQPVQNYVDEQGKYLRGDINSSDPDKRARARRYVWNKENARMTNWEANLDAVAPPSGGRSQTQNWRSDAPPEAPPDRFAEGQYPAILPRPRFADEDFRAWQERHRRENNANRRRNQGQIHVQKVRDNIYGRPIEMNEIGNVEGINAPDEFGPFAGPPLRMTDVERLDPDFQAGDRSRGLDQYRPEEFLTGGAGAQRAEELRLPGVAQANIDAVRRRVAGLNRAAIRRWLRGRDLRVAAQMGLIDPADITAGRFGRPGRNGDRLVPPFNRTGVADWRTEGPRAQQRARDYERELQARKRARLEAEGRDADPSAWKPPLYSDDIY